MKNMNVARISDFQKYIMFFCLYCTLLNLTYKDLVEFHSKCRSTRSKSNYFLPTLVRLFFNAASFLPIYVRHSRFCSKTPPHLTVTSLSLYALNPWSLPAKISHFHSFSLFSRWRFLHLASCPDARETWRPLTTIRLLPTRDPGLFGDAGGVLPFSWWNSPHLWRSPTPAPSRRSLTSIAAVSVENWIWVELFRRMNLLADGSTGTTKTIFGHRPLLVPF